MITEETVFKRKKTLPLQVIRQRNSLEAHFCHFHTTEFNPLNSTYGLEHCKNLKNLFSLKQISL